jgi:hypothetical protein
MTDRRSLIEDEVFAIGRSGEMPEVALHASYFYLREDPEGPRLRLTPEEEQHLKDAVEQRYRRILMRDLNPRYRDRSIYRGLARAMANWQRLARFCDREGRAVEDHRQAAAEALQAFLATEAEEAAKGRKPGAVNCTAAELEAFARTLGLTPAELPSSWTRLCV